MRARDKTFKLNCKGLSIKVVNERISRFGNDNNYRWDELNFVKKLKYWLRITMLPGI